MEKKNYYNRVFIVNFIAVVLFILSLFFNVFLEITKFEENVGGPTVIYTLYKGYELVFFDFDIGIPFGMIPLILAIIGIIIGLQKLKLSQIFVGGGISLAFIIINFIFITVQFMIQEENNNELNGIYALERKTSLQIGLGYILVTLSFMLVVASTILLVLDNKKKKKIVAINEKIKSKDKKIANQ